VHLFIWIHVAIIGGGISSGVILQRFPEKDWPDTPFIEGIEWVNFFLLLFFLRYSLRYSYIVMLFMCISSYSFVNHKDGPYRQRGKNHAFLFRY